MLAPQIQRLPVTSVQYRILRTPQKSCGSPRSRFILACYQRTYTFASSPVQVRLSNPIYRAGLTVQFAAVAFGVVVLASCTVYNWATAAPSALDIEDRSPEQALLQEAASGRLPLHSVDAMPLPPPGRPGNLTDDQRARLCEFWGALLNVFGVYAGPHTEVNRSDTDGASAHRVQADEKGRKDTAGTEKQKKRLGLFGKSRKDKELNPPASGEATARASTEADDKYGQVKQFKEVLLSQTPQDLRKTFWDMVKHDDPDALLLRFLRARKWDVEKALVMLVSTMHWRAEEAHVDDDVVRVGDGGALEASKTGDLAARKEAEDFLAQLRMGKSYLHGTDSEGRPICFVRVRLHKQGEQSESSLERYTVYVIETARYMLSTSTDMATIVFDMTDFSMANMDYTPVKFMIKCFEANYPESLGVILVHKAPWVFQGIWTIIKGWLDPVVARKVHFTKTVGDLEGYIPRNRIVKELGGDDDWSYSYAEPRLDENARMTDGNEEISKKQLLATRDEIVREYEQATIGWIDPHVTSTRNEERALLAEGLRKNYWMLDPYLRARTHYDRIGVIQGGGKLEFYPSPMGITTTATTTATATATATNVINTNSTSEQATSVAPGNSIPQTQTRPDDVD